MGCKLERNNNGAFKDTTGRTVRYGLGNISKTHSEKMKSSDLVGFTQILITPEMVGKTLAVITACEVKAEGWNHNKKLDKREQAQHNWMQWVRLHGGIAGFAQSVSDFNNLIDNFILELKR